MNAERLLQFASDFVEEYNQLRIVGLLQEVIQLCTQRPTSSTPQFVATSQTLKQQARTIIENTRFSVYPLTYLAIISKTPYINFLPARIAALIITGLTEDVATTMSANECNAFLVEANSVFSELSGLVRTLQKMGVAPLTLSGDQVCIEFNLPRVSFDNNAQDYLLWNERANSIIIAYHEYLGENQEKPKLVFTSSTDPIVGYTAYITAAYAVTKLINGLLTIGKNSIELYSAIKRLRESNLSERMTEIEANAEALTKSDVEKEVEKTLRGLQTNLDDGRSNEVRNRIVINAVLFVPIIIDGASISISPESLSKLTNENLKIIGEDHLKFFELLIVPHGVV